MREVEFMDEYFIKSLDELEKEFNTDINHGLSADQVKKNKETYGSNSLRKEKQESIFERIINAAKEPMTILLIFAVLLAIGVNIFKGASGGEIDYFECIGIFFAIFLSIFITVIMEDRSQKAFDSLNKLNDDIQVRVRRNGEMNLIPISDVVAGDIVYLELGNKIPADGRIIKCNDFTVDESMLTGESIHVTKDSEAEFNDVDVPIAERINMVYSGCFVSSGNAEALVTKVGEKTEFGKIANELNDNKENNSTPLQEKLAKLSKIISVFGISAAGVAFLFQILIYFLKSNLTISGVLEIFINSVALIVACVPEGLPTTVAISLAINVIRMSKENALVKKMIACETVGCINVICSDKTGTLTKNQMSVSYVSNGNETTTCLNKNDIELINNFCLNNTSDIRYEDNKLKFIGNPTECALLEAINREGLNYDKIRNEYEVIFTIPFSSETKRMIVVTKSKKDSNIVIYIKGSPEKVLDICNQHNDKELLLKDMAKFQEKAMRMISFAHVNVDHEILKESDISQLYGSFEYDGFVAIEDPLREDVLDAINKCKKAGIDLKILTGDNLITAKSIASKLNIIDKDHIAIQANELERLNDNEFLNIINKISVIARSTPSIKMRVVNALKKLSNVVAVTGDGINDAPAIKNADVGIAMGITGTEVSKQASDIVLLDDSFSTIVKAIHWGRNIYENIKRFVMFQLTVNIASVISVLAVILLGFDSPFSALQLLWINIIMDGPPALTLGLEPIREDLMNNKPTKRNESIVSKKIFMKIIINAIFISGMFMLQYFTNFIGGTKEQEASILFSLFIMFQLFNAFNCREVDETSIFKNILKNKLMIIAFACTFLLQIVMTQFLGAFLKVSPLPVEIWIKIILTSLSVIVFSEILKVIERFFKKN